MTESNSHASVDKVLKLLSILSCNTKYLKNEIIQRLDISERSFYRYLESLKQFGFVIDNIDGYYSIPKNSQNFKEISSLLHFSEEEAFILIQAIHSIDATTKARENLISKLSALFDSDRIAVKFVGKEKSTKIKPLLDAIRTKKQIKINGYLSSGSGNITNRVLEPFDFTPNYVSVWAFEPKSMMCKLFKVSRMQNVEIVNHDWEFQDKHKSQSIDCFRIGGETKVFVRFEMTLLAKNLLCEEYPVSEKFITKLNDNKYLFDGWVNSFHGVGRFIMGLIDNVSNIDNPNLKLYLKDKLKFVENI